MRWFFIWIMSLPLGAFAQSNLVDTNAEKGCDCGQIDSSNIQIIEGTVKTGQVSGRLAACYFHCIGAFYYNDVDNRDCLKSIKNYGDALALRKENHRENYGLQRMLLITLPKYLGERNRVTITKNALSNMLIWLFVCTEKRGKMNIILPKP